MKITNTSEEIKAIVAAIKPLHVSLFTNHSCDPKYDAQRNLSGRTHYVDDDTLRFHHSRITGRAVLADGLLFSLTHSDSLDMRNTSRGFRCTVFDVFGTVVYSPDLDQAVKSGEKAIAERNKAEFDVVAHYRKAIADKVRHTKDELHALVGIASALEAIPSVETIAV